MFIMYHATPMFRYSAIVKQGLTPRMSPLFLGLWSPKVPVIYLTDSVDTAKNYADRAYKMRKTTARAWAIFEVMYDEFPNEVYVDLMWGLPGTYYVTIPIEPRHLRMLEQYFVMGVIRDRKKASMSGEKIASELGIHYDGVQGGVGMQFTDVDHTGTTFYANTLEEARTKLAEKRELFGAVE